MVKYLFKTLNVGMCDVVVFVLTKYCSVIFILCMEVLHIKFICVFFFFFFKWERNSVINWLKVQCNLNFVLKKNGLYIIFLILNNR